MTEGKVLYSADFTPVGSPCLECGGKGFNEYNAGLLQVECGACHGTGKIGEVIDDNPTDGGTGADNKPARGTNSRKSKQHKKSRARSKARKKSG